MEPIYTLPKWRGEDIGSCSSKPIGTSHPIKRHKTVKVEEESVEPAVTCPALEQEVTEVEEEPVGLTVANPVPEQRPEETQEQYLDTDGKLAMTIRMSLGGDCVVAEEEDDHSKNIRGGGIGSSTDWQPSSNGGVLPH